MLITVQFPIFDARGLRGSSSARLLKPTWPLPIPGQHFVRGFGGIVARRPNGLAGFFSEDRICNADNALRLSSRKKKPGTFASQISFRHLFSDGDGVVKFEIGFFFRGIKAAMPLKRNFLSTLLADLLAQKAFIGQPDHLQETLLVNSGRHLASLYCKATTHRPTGLKASWSRLKGTFRTQNDAVCFAGQVLVSVNIALPSARKPSFGRVVDFGDAFLWSWDQKVIDETVKVILIVETARRASDLARNLRIFLNRVHAELLASEYGLTAIEAGLRGARTEDDVAEAMRKLRAFESRIRGLINRIDRSISALCARRRAQVTVPPVHTVLEMIWDWRVDTVMDRYALIREKAARLGGKLPSSRTAALLRADLRSMLLVKAPTALAVFISYRREDTRDLTGRIDDFLARSELQVRIFRDLASIEPGSNWRTEIENGLREAHVILAVFGPNWAGRSQTGRVRIADPDDAVRYEIESAIKLKKDLVPVVVQGTKFPPSDLPDCLRPLIAIQAFVLDPERGFDQSMRSLMKILQVSGRARS
jgi:hypothetical protein